MREGGAAFGCLAKLATRRGSPLRPVAPQKMAEEEAEVM